VSERPPPAECRRHKGDWSGLSSPTSESLRQLTAYPSSPDDLLPAYGSRRTRPAPPRCHRHSTTPTGQDKEARRLGNGRAGRGGDEHGVYSSSPAAIHRTGGPPRSTDKRSPAARSTRTLGRSNSASAAPQSRPAAAYDLIARCCPRGGRATGRRARGGSPKARGLGTQRLPGLPGRAAQGGYGGGPRRAASRQGLALAGATHASACERAPHRHRAKGRRRDSAP